MNEQERIRTMEKILTSGKIRITTTIKSKPQKCPKCGRIMKILEAAERSYSDQPCVYPFAGSLP